MANPEHVEVVKQGAEAILKWREENPGVTLDLSEADLFMRNLARAHLGVANLAWADLGGADLRGATLRKANLTETNLARANLREVRGAHHARRLETVRLREGDAQCFETCKRPWPELWFEWKS